MLKLRRFGAFLFFAVSILLLKACAQEKGGEQMEFLSEEYSKFPYSLNEPTMKYVLGGKLREISGLTYYKKNRVLCVNDEKGIIFDYDLKDQRIRHQYKFAKSGDYEGIELIDSVVYILRSDGKIYRVDHFRKESPFVQEYKTALKARNDTEGLGYNPNTQTLYVACKARSGIHQNYVGKRAIYGFDIKTHRLDTVPAILVDLENLRKIMNFSGYARFSIKLLKTVNPIEGDITFQPSAIAVHPFSGNIYLLGAVGKMVLVLNPRGDILAVIKLDPKIFRQPEGICFAPDGTLYISNEGKGGKATILKFKYNE